MNVNQLITIMLTLEDKLAQEPSDKNVLECLSEVYMYVSRIKGGGELVYPSKINQKSYYFLPRKQWTKKS